MSPTISRTNLVILRRRMNAATKRRDTAKTVFVGFAAPAVLVGIFGVAGLFTGHAGEMEPLRLFLMSLTAAFAVVSLSGGVFALVLGRALTVAEEALIRAGEMPSDDEMVF